MGKNLSHQLAVVVDVAVSFARICCAMQSVDDVAVRNDQNIGMLLCLIAKVDEN